MTHYTIREERGLPRERVIADDAAPIHHCRKVAPPLLLLAADNDMESRLEEVKLFHAVMTKVAGNKTTDLLVVPDRTHNSINDKLLTPGDPAGEAVLAFVQKWTPAAGNGTK